MELDEKESYREIKFTRLKSCPVRLITFGFKQVTNATLKELKEWLECPTEPDGSVFRTPTSDRNMY